MRFRLARIAAAFTFAACMTLAPAVALADEAAAETYFQEGLAAMKRNDFAVACEAFSQSNRADPSPGTQINLALCFEKQKKWASAWTWYRSAVGLAQQRGQKEREQLAADSANRLKAQLHYIVVVLKEPLTDAVIKRDGSEVAITIGGKEVPLPIDPGEHTIEVTARGKKPLVHKIQIADTPQTERIEIPPLEDLPAEDRKPEPPPAAPSKPVAVHDGATQRTAGIITGAAGILAGLAGVGMFVLAKDQESERNSLREQARSETRENAERLNRSAESFNKAAQNDQLIAIILGAGAAVLVGAGAVLYFTAPKAAEKVARSPIVPLLGHGFAGLSFAQRF